jgi:putative ABC transport system ATP-binding protein
MDLHAKNVTVTIDGREIVRDATIACTSSTMTALVGPSGSGKTTLLHCLGLLQVPSDGAVYIGGDDTTSWRAGARRRFWRDQAAFVLQDYGIMDEESVAFNVTMAMGVLGRRVGGDKPRMLQSLSATGLEGRASDLASHLSGGEKQRLGVARAIYKDARCIFVDEPTASLDRENRQRVIDLFRERARQGCTVVVASHDSMMIDACDQQFHLV